MSFSRAVGLGIKPSGELHAYGFSAGYGSDPDVLNAAWRRVLRTYRRDQGDAAEVRAYL